MSIGPLIKALEQFIWRLESWTANGENKDLCVHLNMVMISDLDLDMPQDSGTSSVRHRGEGSISIVCLICVLKECRGIKCMIILNTD